MGAQEDQPGAAPPTVRPSVRIVRESPPWPTAIGSVAIVWAGLGMMRGLWVFLGAGGYRGVAPITPAGVPDFEQIRAATHDLDLLDSGTLIGLGMVLMAGGIGLTYRRRWSVPILQAWAVARLVTEMIVIAWTLQVSRRFSSMGGPTALVGGSAAVLGPLFELVFVSALPVFVIVWFQLPHVREERARWRARKFVGRPAVRSG